MNASTNHLSEANHSFVVSDKCFFYLPRWVEMAVIIGTVMQITKASSVTNIFESTQRKMGEMWALSGGYGQKNGELFCCLFRKR